LRKQTIGELLSVATDPLTRSTLVHLPRVAECPVTTLPGFSSPGVLWALGPQRDLGLQPGERRSS
jgi:hypothetical protein